LFGKRRNPYDFLFEITQACRFPATKTDIYHIVKTTYEDFQRWLNVALQVKLIEATAQGNKYLITQKGHGFLTKWQELQTFLKEE